LGGIRANPVTLRIDFWTESIDIVTEAVLASIAQWMVGRAGWQYETQ
jgi:hypothetical protein